MPLNYCIYPNQTPRVANVKGPLRVGTVEENTDTLVRGIAGDIAAVTTERGGRVRFYVWSVAGEDENVPTWTGPYLGLSEEILA